MAQTLSVITVTVATHGTQQRVVTDINSPHRYVASVYFEALNTNDGLIYIGDADVSATNYAAVLNGSGVDRGLNWTAINYPPSPTKLITNENLIDLYNTWVDCSDDGDVVFVTIDPSMS